MLVSSFAADKGLIHFDWDTPMASSGVYVIFMHGEANPVKHEPSALLGNADVTGNFVAAHTVFAVSNHPRCQYPLIEPQR